jgi:hypothetical protein
MKYWVGTLIIGMLAIGAVQGTGPVDSPFSTEPRVAVAKSLSDVGFLSSLGEKQPFRRVRKGDTLYSRDLLLTLPGFRVELEPSGKGVGILMWGNLPELSSSPVLESAIILHDSKAYDLDLTLLRGRVILTNTKEKGSAKIWLRTEENAVEFDLEEPGTQVAIESYGRWPAGIPFYPNRKRGDDPTRSWEIFVLKGRLGIKAARTSWTMTAPPGRSYFYGDSINGPYDGGPQPVQSVPDWADPKAIPDKTAKMMRSVMEAYAGKLAGTDPNTLIGDYFKLAAEDKDTTRAAMVRKVLVTSLTALDEVKKVVELLETSPYPEVRDSAVIGLRHWIGSRGGRDDKLYNILMEESGYSKNEAAAIMEMLHSPFDRDAIETYQTLIAFLKHRRQAIRELAHWHLIRLEPKGAEIPYDASGSAEERAKAVAAWLKLKAGEGKE